MDGISSNAKPDLMWFVSSSWNIQDQDFDNMLYAGQNIIFGDLHHSVIFCPLQVENIQLSIC